MIQEEVYQFKVEGVVQYFCREGVVTVVFIGSHLEGALIRSSTMYREHVATDLTLKYCLVRFV